jgi:hypothetical protein
MDRELVCAIAAPADPQCTTSILSLSLSRVWSRMNLEGVAEILLALIRAHRT